jgi:hypothetical protein
MTADELFSKIKVLNERLWEHRAPRRNIDDWLSNFAGPLVDNEGEQLYALYLLSQFIYFGDHELREMLKSLFRDKFRYRLIEAIRRSHADTVDRSIIEPLFTQALQKTRFLGMGNPAESGTHLLYFFRQENHLSKDLFIQTVELFNRPTSAPDVGLADPTIERLVFIDDFCASGDQAVLYSNQLLSTLVEISNRTNQKIETFYLVLIGTKHGLSEVRSKTEFDHADAVFVLDDTYKCFHPSSRYFGAANSLDKAFAHEMCRRYGTKLYPKNPLGYKDSQLLLGFHHNIPDNTLPVIWYAEPDHPEWEPIFRRYEKIYG